MSRNIKTVKCLMKHVGKTVHVVSADGFNFDAEVCLRGPAHDQWLCLFTDDKVADKDSYWWESSGKYGHACSRDYQITEELKSLTLVTRKNSKKETVKVTKKPRKTKKKFLTVSEINAGIGHFCKLADGQEAFIATNYGDAATICMRSRFRDIGWRLDASDVAPKFEDIIRDYNYGWHVFNEETAKDIKVVCILDKPEEEKTEQSKKDILDMTVKELLEKLNAFIKC